MVKEIRILPREHGKRYYLMKSIYERIRRKSFKRTVNRIVDGDTFIVKPDILGFYRIRLSGVDTPEIGSGEKAKKMTKFLEKKILGKTVKLTIVGYNPPKGQYPGRWVAEVFSGLFSQINVSDLVQKEMTKKSFKDKILRR